MEIYVLDFADIVVKYFQDLLFSPHKECFSVFFPRWLFLNKRGQKGVRVFVIFHWFWKNIYIYFLKKWVVWDQNVSVKNKELLIITKSADTLLYSSVSSSPYKILKETDNRFWYWHSTTITSFDFYLICF